MKRKSTAHAAAMPTALVASFVSGPTHKRRRTKGRRSSSAGWPAGLASQASSSVASGLSAVRRSGQGLSLDGWGGGSRRKRRRRSRKRMMRLARNAGTVVSVLTFAAEMAGSIKQLQEAAGSDRATGSTRRRPPASAADRASRAEPSAPAPAKRRASAGAPDQPGRNGRTATQTKAPARSGTSANSGRGSSRKGSAARSESTKATKSSSSRNGDTATRATRTTNRVSTDGGSRRTNRAEPTRTRRRPAEATSGASRNGSDQ
jgi:hypothetical protein